MHTCAIAVKKNYFTAIANTEGNTRGFLLIKTLLGTRN